MLIFYQNKILVVLARRTHPVLVNFLQFHPTRTNKDEKYTSENVALMSHVPGSVKACPENNQPGFTTPKLTQESTNRAGTTVSKYCYHLWVDDDAERTFEKVICM